MKITLNEIDIRNLIVKHIEDKYPADIRTRWVLGNCDGWSAEIDLKPIPESERE